MLCTCRVRHGYTAGTDFLNRTRTREHRTRNGYGYIPHRNLHSIKRVPARINYNNIIIIIKYILKNNKGGRYAWCHMEPALALPHSPCNLMKVAHMSIDVAVRSMRDRGRRGGGMRVPALALVCCPHVCPCAVVCVRAHSPPHLSPHSRMSPHPPFLFSLAHACRCTIVRVCTQSFVCVLVPTGLSHSCELALLALVSLPCLCLHHIVST